MVQRYHGTTQEHVGRSPTIRSSSLDDPAEYKRIAELRNGIRAGRYSTTKGRFVLCRAGDYQQLMLLDGDGQTITRDIPTILGLIRVAPDEPKLPVDPDHNRAVARAKAEFAQEAWQRQVEQQQTERLSQAQRFVMRELRSAYTQTTDADLLAQIDTLEAAFRQPLPRVAQSELNALRRAELTGLRLVEELTGLYSRFGLDKQQRGAISERGDQSPLIVCSEVLD